MQLQKQVYLPSRILAAAAAAAMQHRKQLPLRMPRALHKVARHKCRLRPIACSDFCDGYPEAGIWGQTHEQKGSYVIQPSFQLARHTLETRWSSSQHSHPIPLGPRAHARISPLPSLYRSHARKGFPISFQTSKLTTFVCRWPVAASEIPLMQ